jgi:hypothetical protein
MRLNKLEPIQGLTNIKRLEPIPSLSPPIVSGATITLLIAHLLHDQSLLIDTVVDEGEKNLQFYTSMKMIKYLFKADKEGYMMLKEFNKIKRDFNIRFGQ